jgi:hypothetical protein
MLSFKKAGSAEYFPYPSPSAVFRETGGESPASRIVRFMTEKSLPDIKPAMARRGKILTADRPRVNAHDSPVQVGDVFHRGPVGGNRKPRCRHVLFGDAKPTEKFPRAGPLINHQFAANKMDGEPLFKFGFSLTY